MGHDEAVRVTAKFARLKNTLMPYLYRAGAVAAATGLSVARPMFVEFPGDPAVGYLDRQYMLGPDLLVAPVLSADGHVDVYLPEGAWTDFWTGEVLRGGRWVRQHHGFDTVGLFVREGALVPFGAREDRPDYDYLDGLVIRAYGVDDGEIEGEIVVVQPDGSEHLVSVTGSPVAPVASREGVRVDVVSRRTTSS